MLGAPTLPFVPYETSTACLLRLSLNQGCVRGSLGPRLYRCSQESDSVLSKVGVVPALQPELRPDSFLKGGHVTSHGQRVRVAGPAELVHLNNAPASWVRATRRRAHCRCRDQTLEFCNSDDGCGQVQKRTHVTSRFVTRAEGWTSPGAHAQGHAQHPLSTRTGDITHSARK